MTGSKGWWCDVRTAKAAASGVDVGVFELVGDAHEAVLKVSIPEAEEPISAARIISAVQRLPFEGSRTRMHIDMV